MDESQVTHLDKIISNRVTSGVVILDTSGEILFVNDEAQSIISTLHSALMKLMHQAIRIPLTKP
jgi:sensor histidine kinase regulating citrate/malate metabolism